MPNVIDATQSISLNTVAAISADGPPDIIGTHDDVALNTNAAGLIPLADIRSCRADVRLACHNVIIGRDAVTAAREAIEATGFRVDWARLAKLDSLSRALAHCARLADASNGEPSAVVTLLREARPLRRVLLLSARTHAAQNRCPVGEVERVMRGTGDLDAAQDLVDLAFLHTQHGLAGETVTAAQVTRAKVVGTALIPMIRTAGARRPPRTNAQRDAINLRDRLWTVMFQTHAHLDQAGGALWGRALKDHVPALQARYVPRKRDKAPAAPVTG